MRKYAQSGWRAPARAVCHSARNSKTLFQRLQRNSSDSTTILHRHTTLHRHTAQRVGRPASLMLGLPQMQPRFSKSAFQSTSSRGMLLSIHEWDGPGCAVTAGIATAIAIGCAVVAGIILFPIRSAPALRLASTMRAMRCSASSMARWSVASASVPTSLRAICTFRWSSDAEVAVRKFSSSGFSSCARLHRQRRVSWSKHRQYNCISEGPPLG
eukprot:scaffold302925_cov31-Tisochrysis_lutea.AAC.1